jgi:hypothetical protein
MAHLRQHAARKAHRAGDKGDGQQSQITIASVTRISPGQRLTGQIVLA